MKSHTNNSKTLKNNSGITLIALVVSVIVLLILAGVSISAITGNESAMEKAKKARTANEQGGELDAIKLAVVSAMAKGTYGMVEGANLANALTGTILDVTDNADQLTAIRSNENGPTWEIESKLGKTYQINANGTVEELTGLILSPKNLALKIQGDTYEEKTVTARLVDIDGTLSWSESTSKIQITPSADNMSATIKALAAGTETITVTCSNGDTATCTVTVTEALEPVLTTKSYVGYYAWVDGVYGVIYADLLMQDPSADKSPWGNSDGSWSLPASLDASAYKSYEYKTLKTSDKTFGNYTNTGVISLKNGTEGADRFYIMGLTQKSASNWNTAKNIKEENSDKWKCPTREEWSIFGSALGITTSNNYGLVYNFWSSSAINNDMVYTADFGNGLINIHNTTGTLSVRLCTTF